MADVKRISGMLLAASVAMFLVAGWCLLWVLSSASLAPGHCRGGWLLLWDTPGCRSAVYAQSGFIVVLAAAVILLVLAMRRPKKSE